VAHGVACFWLACVQTAKRQKHDAVSPVSMLLLDGVTVTRAGSCTVAGRLQQLTHLVYASGDEPAAKRTTCTARYCTL
jgi:hypothetical protein